MRTYTRRFLKKAEGMVAVFFVDTSVEEELETAFWTRRVTLGLMQYNHVASAGDIPTSIIVVVIEA